jgi:hypothetical protein
MVERWVLAAIVLVAGFGLGAIAGWYVRRRLIAARGGEATSAIAGAAGLFVFWILGLVGALFAISMVRPETLEDLPRQVLDYIPRLVAAGLIVIVGYAVAVGASRLVAFGLERASGRTVARAVAVARWAIVGAAAILALAQLGVDTTILILIVALFGFSLALSSALLVGLGGWSLAREIAAGRYFRRFMATGQAIATGSEEGRVVALHPATVELEHADGVRRHVPYTRLLESGLSIRPEGPEPQMPAGSMD